MATIKFRRFIQPDILTAIAPERLISLFTPYSDYLSGRGFILPKYRQIPINYAKLSVILSKPDENLPPQMVDALYFISEMSNTTNVENLMAEFQELHPEMAFDMDASDADIIVQIWLANPDFVAEKQAFSLISKPKSFEYYRSCTPHLKSLATPEPETIRKMEEWMNDWFDKNRRGRNCRILVADHGEVVSFLIRHAMPMQRERKVSNGKADSFCYRPEVFDVTFYDRTRDELGIRATGSKGKKTLYRETIGQFLFGNANQFQGRRKFTLAPLEKDGENALVCSDVDGLEHVTLTAIRNYVNEGLNGQDLFTADDVFRSLQTQGRRIPPASLLNMAGFSMKLAGIKQSRSLTIRPPNHAMYLRDEDSVVIDQWLTKRGFIESA
ncbi:MAG: hypothetical protein HQM06_17930 [Magnetococcales bacterium]|nr:hypothetical protein [Magnetococcales bacterium]